LAASPTGSPPPQRGRTRQRTETTLEAILQRIPALSIGIVGDLFLDRYLEIDDALTEPSLETGLDAYQVVQVRAQPGAAGTVINNLVALGVGQVLPIAVIGDDGEGYELRQALHGQRVVSLEHVFSGPGRRTPTYTKPMLHRADQPARELNRLDIKNRAPTPPASEERILEALDAVWPRVDALLILDQVSEAECGVVTTRVRGRLAELGASAPDKLSLADSRERIGLFRSTWLKPNRHECERAAGKAMMTEAVTALAKQTGRPVFCTCGNAGMVVVDPRSPGPRAETVPAYPVHGPIDIVGAGDSTTAGIACAVAAGARLEEAAAFGNLVASITIQQIGTTGTASPEQVRQRWRLAAKRVTADCGDKLMNQLLWIALLPLTASLPPEPRFRVTEDEERIRIVGPALEASVRKKGYVSGVEAQSLVDVKTGFRELGFGLDIVDWLLEPGSDETHRDRLTTELRYDFNNSYHGKRPKRSVEGPQICTKAGRLSPRVIEGPDFVAVRQDYTYHLAAPGKKAGSRWEQTLVFPAGKRYFLSCDRVTTADAGEATFLRIDMPGHIKHKAADTFSEVYLSYHGRIPAREFLHDFAPDEKFLYVREEGKIPRRFIRAYRTRDPKTGKDGPWLAGMTLDPSAVSEAWCHQRGYVCLIEEVGGRPLKAGESFGAAFVVGFFDSPEEMHEVYDRYAGHNRLEADAKGWRLSKGP
jgi:bifunctional ADP-heptose synthase (sugar kinase/adenylyltransferase)